MAAVTPVARVAEGLREGRAVLDASGMGASDADAVAISARAAAIQRVVAE